MLVSLRLRLVAGALLLALVPAAAQTIRVDSAAPGNPFPHFWERMFGSGRAILSLRDSYRRDLRATKAVTDFEYVRFHAIFHDEVGLYAEDPQGHASYNFSYIDEIYDGLRENGVRPFVELSFMPRSLALAGQPHPFWYQPLPSPPKDYGRWEELISQFGRHLVDRYGIDEVAQWYFEVWNEPNIDFWAGDPKQASYYQLYDHAAAALKRVNSRLRVGGPSTAQAAWVDDFIRHTTEHNVPVDFVSTHVYGNDKAEDVFNTHETIPRSDMVARSVKKVFDQVKHSARPEMPIFWSEFNASYMNEVDVTDSPFLGPWLANTIRLCDGMTTAMSYWTFSDVFEEQGVVKRPFYGGFGLIAAGHIPKASFNAFALLHQLGAERIAVDSDSAIATRRADGTLAIAVWNYAAPEAAGAPREISLAIDGLPAGRRARITRVDRDHGSALTAWEAMGRPDFPTPDQQRELRHAGQMPPSEVRMLATGKTATLTITLAPHCLALVEVVR
jgi:xylan 1,4-beta-xylosidase